MAFKLLFSVAVVSAQLDPDWRFNLIENITPFCSNEKNPSKDCVIMEG